MPVRNDFSPNRQYEIAVCCRDNPKVRPLLNTAAPPVIARRCIDLESLTKLAWLGAPTQTVQVVRQGGATTPGQFC